MIVRKLNSPYITSRQKDTIGAYNLNNEVVATFKGIHLASRMTRVPQPTSNHQLNGMKRSTPNNDLTFRRVDG